MNPIDAFKAFLRQSGKNQIDVMTRDESLPRGAKRRPDLGAMAVSDTSPREYVSERSIEDFAPSPSPTRPPLTITAGPNQGASRRMREDLKRARDAGMYKGSEDAFYRAWREFGGDELMKNVPTPTPTMMPEPEMAVAGAVAPTGSTDWQAFARIAAKVAREQGFPVRVLLGQAALETGRRASPGNNFFGIKGSGTAGTQNLATKEDDGSGNLYETRANFAAYNNPEDSIKAYINLIKTRYPEAWKNRKDPVKMLRAIKAAGYATDMNYVPKVMGTPEFQGAYGD